MVLSLADLKAKYYARGAVQETPLFVASTPSVPAAANILTGFASHAVTTAATTVVTIPAGKTWRGEISLSAAVANAAAAAVAGVARGIVSIAGAGATPAAGTITALEAKSGANAATGTSGSQGNSVKTTSVVVIAPAGNSVAIQLASTIAGTSGVVDVTISGELL